MNEEPRQVFIRLSPKLVRRRGYHFPANSWTHAHFCPACNELHDFAVEQPFTNNARWTFDGNGAAPTFAPSMNITIGPFPHGEAEAGRIDVCHYFLQQGKLVYLGDCTHALKGQTVELPDIPDKALQYAQELTHE